MTSTVIDEMLNLLVIHAKVHHKTKERAFSLVPDLRTKAVILEFQTLSTFVHIYSDLIEQKLRLN